MSLLGALPTLHLLIATIYIQPAFLKVQPLLFLGKTWQGAQHIYILHACIGTVPMYTSTQGNSSQPGCPDFVRSHCCPPPQGSLLSSVKNQDSPLRIRECHFGWN